MGELDWKEARRQQHSVIWAETEKRRVANADNFDKAILTYSSGGLALSLAFLKDFVPISSAAFAPMLYASWALFLTAIVCTMASYVTSQYSQERQLAISRKYNIDLIDSALDQPNWPQRFTEWGSFAAGLTFFLAIVGSTLFVGLNLKNGPNVTKSTHGLGRDGMPTVIIEKIQNTNVQKGAPVPVIEPIMPPQQQPGSGGSANQTPAQVPASKN
jgi:hypothetical protein